MADGGPPEAAVARLVDMGFGRDEAARALAATGAGSAEAAMEWLLRGGQRRAAAAAPPPDCPPFLAEKHQARVDRFFAGPQLAATADGAGKPPTMPLTDAAAPAASEEAVGSPNLVPPQPEVNDWCTSAQPPPRDTSGSDDVQPLDQRGPKRPRLAAAGERQQLGAHHASARQHRRVVTDAPFTPLAERMRPRSLDDIAGQDHLLGPGRILRKLLAKGAVPSMILWGPPGSGKTTLARIISQMVSFRYVALSAVTSGVKDVRAVLDAAKATRKCGQRTLLFVDEVHRFNKSQQDAFLPAVEAGDVILVGATTENPSFELNSALLSRCKVFTLNKLQPGDVLSLLRRAVSDEQHGLPMTILEQVQEATSARSSTAQVVVADDALQFLAAAADGDARAALGTLEMAALAAVAEDAAAATTRAEQAVLSSEEPIARSGQPEGAEDFPTLSNGGFEDSDGHAQTAGTPRRVVEVALAAVRSALQRSHVAYDKTGDEHYNIISALHKSMRGGDANAALYWLARMLEGGEGPLYVVRRLVRFASEDVGLADPQALVQAVATFQACQFLGMPECNVNLAQCAAYLALAPKSVAVYRGIEAAQQAVRGSKQNEPVPLHLQNAPTKLMKDLNYGKDYIYPPSHDGAVEQDYLPPSLKDLKLFMWPLESQAQCPALQNGKPLLSEPVLATIRPATLANQHLPDTNLGSN
eukprot:SM000018S03696  [mRNA]  locus=s18:795497:799165:- [translate_table: standard]